MSDKESKSPKKKLNLSVQEHIIKRAKIIAISEDLTLSELFEDLITAINKDKSRVLKTIQEINSPDYKKKGK